jgi:23S rRNA (cytosine1962-C5)-methyltransferase
MELLGPSQWKEYELIDSGGFEKLERFGKYVLARPEPQAVWQKALSPASWDEMANARYRRLKGVDPGKSDQTEKGEWQKRPSMPDQWNMAYDYKDLHLKFRLGLTSFGHVGVFPEQSRNWEYIYDFISLRTTEGSPFRLLNLFAYTGAASLSARAAGAEVVHVDSVKMTVSWAREMMELSRIDGIRWVVEDALKFVRRESKRGSHYDAVILDPPAYGRGPEGEKWVLQERIDEMIGLCKQILRPDKGFMLFSLYSMGFSSLIAENLVKSHFGSEVRTYPSELFIPDRAGRRLPLGTLLRLET